MTSESATLNTPYQKSSLVNQCLFAKVLSFFDRGIVTQECPFQTFIVPIHKARMVKKLNLATLKGEIVWEDKRPISRCLSPKQVRCGSVPTQRSSGTSIVPRRQKSSRLKQSSFDLDVPSDSMTNQRVGQAKTTAFDNLPTVPKPLTLDELIRNDKWRRVAREQKEKAGHHSDSESSLLTIADAEMEREDSWVGSKQRLRQYSSKGVIASDTTTITFPQLIFESDRVTVKFVTEPGAFMSSIHLKEFKHNAMNAPLQLAKRNGSSACSSLASTAA